MYKGTEKHNCRKLNSGRNKFGDGAIPKFLCRLLRQRTHVCLFGEGQRSRYSLSHNRNKKHNNIQGMKLFGQTRVLFTELETSKLTKFARREKEFLCDMLADGDVENMPYMVAAVGFANYRCFFLRSDARCENGTRFQRRATSHMIFTRHCPVSLARLCVNVKQSADCKLKARQHVT